MIWIRGNSSFGEGYLFVKTLLYCWSIWVSIQPPLPSPPPSLSLSLSLPPLSLNIPHQALVLFWSWIIFIPVHLAGKSLKPKENSEPPSPLFSVRAHAPDPAHPRNRPTGRSTLIHAPAHKQTSLHTILRLSLISITHLL